MLKFSEEEAYPRRNAAPEPRLVLFHQLLRPPPPPLDMNSISRAVSGTY